MLLAAFWQRLTSAAVLSPLQSAAPLPRPSCEPVLRVEAVSKTFGRASALDRVSLEVSSGEMVGLFGEDGAGKTCVFEAITGLLAVDEGSVLLGGVDVTALPIDRRAPLGLSYLSQEPSIFRGMTVAQNIDAVLELRHDHPDRRRQRLDWLLTEFNIDYVRDTPALHLSGGERRRCEIARALATSPAVMLLDEPFAGVDPLTVASIAAALRTLRRLGIGILVSDQNVDAMMTLIDRAYVLHAGRIVFSGAPLEMLEDEAVRRNYLGKDYARCPTAPRDGGPPCGKAAAQRNSRQLHLADAG